MMVAGGRPKAPVAEGGPVVFDGGNRRDWFPGVRGPRAASCDQRNHENRNDYLPFLTMAAIRRIYSGFVPQQPPMMFAPLSIVRGMC